MKILRAGLNLAVAGVLLFSACWGPDGHASQSPTERPQGYPGKPIRVLVGSSPGGGTDIMARLVGRKLGESWGASVIIENRPGASGAVAMGILARSAPDGYTISISGNSLILTGAQGKVPFDIRTALDAVGQLTTQPYLMVVHPSLPVTSVKELIALARKQPGALNYGSSGAGSVIHLGTELLCAMAGIRMVHVAYKGVSPALIDTMTGQIQLLLSNGIAAAPHLRSGKLRAIAVTTAQPTALFPGLPTVAGSGIPGYELSNMYAVYAPSGLPPAILSALHREFGRIMNAPEMRKRLAADGAEPAASMSQAQFKDLYLAEINKWVEFIRKSGVKVD